MYIQSIAKEVRKTFRLALTASLIGAMPVPAVAQTVDEEPAISSDGGLDLPTNINFLAKTDPNLHKATAVVNGKIITSTDVDQRFALIVAANGGQIPENQKDALRLQVLRNLIDETLQIQEAAANEIVISQEEIMQSYARLAANFRQTPQQFEGFLRSKGSSPASIKRQIEGETAWSRLLRRKVQPLVTVSADEAKSVLERMSASKGKEEYRVGEIYLAATPENAAQIEANARNIIEQIRGGASFAAYARQFSEASTASVGGDLGWVRPAQLPEELGTVITQVTVGQIAGPVRLAGGFSILLLIDKRQVLTADPRDSVLSLKQLQIKFPAGTTQAQATPKVKAFAEALTTMQGCGAANQLGQTFNADVVDNDNIRIRDLPPALQKLLVELQIGQATPPFGSVADGVRSLVLCGRDDAKEANLPSFEQIMTQLEDDRINKRARIYLRDLRRDALIDYN